MDLPSEDVLVKLKRPSLQTYAKVRSCSILDCYLFLTRTTEIQHKGELLKLCHHSTAPSSEERWYCKYCSSPGRARRVASAEVEAQTKGA